MSKDQRARRAARDADAGNGGGEADAVPPPVRVPGGKGAPLGPAIVLPRSEGGSDDVGAGVADADDDELPPIIPPPARTCPYCQTPIAPGEQCILCAECQMPHHPACWADNGGCTTYACSQGPRDTSAKARRRAEQERLEREQLEREPRESDEPHRLPHATAAAAPRVGWPAWKTATLVMGALLLIVVMLAVAANRPRGTEERTSVPLGTHAGEERTGSDRAVDTVEQPSERAAGVTVPTGTRAGEEWTGPDGGVYVWVPSGEFMMGSADDDPEALDDEKPARRVRITQGFWLGKYEVTNAQYRAFCEATGREFPERSDQGDDCPVVYVSWDDAVAYAEHYALRLPTEAEWEYAARGPDRRKYPWGDEWDPARLCWRENQGPPWQTFPVGSFPAGASWVGALDMAGNVYEWVADWYGRDYYRVGPAEDPLGPRETEATDVVTIKGQLGEFEVVKHDKVRVARGGSWGDDDPRQFRCARRYHFDFPTGRFYVFSGFRCAREL